MAKRKLIPATLRRIAYIDNPLERAEALLKIENPDPYDEVYSLLVSTVGISNAGEAGRKVNENSPEEWDTAEYDDYCHEHLPHLRTPCPRSQVHVLNMNHSFEELESMADRLLQSGDWKKRKFAIYVYKASCFSAGPQAIRLRALAFSEGIIELRHWSEPPDRPT